MNNSSSFRAWLKRRRLERGLTQEELGELVGYAAQTITKIEGGQRRPSPQLARRLAEALALAPEEHAAWMAAALADTGAAAAETAAHTPAPPADSLSRCSYPPRHRTLADDDTSPRGSCPTPMQCSDMVQ